MVKILHLTLKKKWFDLIKEGKKKEEYKEIKPYWEKRFTYAGYFGLSDMLHFTKKYDEIYFRNGYKQDSPFMRVEWKGLKFGWFEGKQVFAIQLGKVLEIVDN